MSASKSQSQSDQIYLDRKPYVFGSSTPREFSYMNHVPAEYRIYDAKLRKSRRTRDEMTLSDYLRQIRSSSPSKRRDRSVDSAKIYVFGSSTPRNWSFMDKIPVEYRVYDTSLNVYRRNKRSKTTSFVPTDYSTNHHKPIYALKSYSTLGVSQSGHGPEMSNNRHKSDNHTKKSERNRSVPPSSSSSRQNGPPSVDSQRSSKSERSSSSHRNVPNKINVNYDRNSSNQGSVDKNSSTITTPNEELVLIVTETVTNLETPSVINGNHDETISVDHDVAQNTAYSSYIEKQVHQVENSLTQLVNGQKSLVEVIEPQNVSHDKTIENENGSHIEPHGTTIEPENGSNGEPHGTAIESDNMQNKDMNHETDAGDENSESEVESSRSSKTIRPVSAIRRSFDIHNDVHDDDKSHNEEFTNKSHTHDDGDVIANNITAESKVTANDHSDNDHDHDDDSDQHNFTSVPKYNDSPQRSVTETEKHEGLVN